MAKRIVYTIDDPNYGGGAHVATFNQMRHVHRELGWDVTVLALEDPSDAIRAAYPFITFIGPAILKKRHPSEDALLAALIRRVRPDDTVCVPFENSRFRQPVAEVHCAWKVQWIHIDYAHWSNLNSETRAISADDGTLYQHFDRVAFISQMSLDGFAARYPHLREKCRVCHNLMDTERIRRLAAEAPQQDFFTGSGLRLVTVARLEERQKAIGRCLLAAQALRDKGLDFEWLFVGSGVPEDMPLYRDFVKRVGLGENVHFAGPQQNPFAYMRIADLFCLFSRYEGIPNTIFEALITGTPVAATRVGAVPEQILPGIGWLCENDTQSMVQLLETLIRNHALVRNARQSLSGYYYDNTAIHQTIRAVFDPTQEEAQAMNPAVSVIVPVYNVQDYLDECLASLESQTLADIEVIMVNDGSTDASSEVMDRYVARNPGRFFRYDKENGGLGDARNYGIDRAKGSYLAFIDSDDFVDSDMMERMYAAVQKHNCDIVQGGMIIFDNNEDYQAVEPMPFDDEGIISQQDLMLNATRPVVVSACTKLYRKSLFGSLRFPNIWYEDLGLTPILFSHLEACFYYLPQPFYHYRWGRPGSIQNSINSSRTLEVLQAQQRVMELCKPQWLREAEFAVYDHTCKIYRKFPALSTHTIDFVHKNAIRFQNNPYIQKAIASGELANLLPEETALPKTIHYFRFGNGALSPQAQACRDSWRRFLPQYQLRQWTEQDFDLAENPYLQRAWMLGDYAAASGYLACKVLSREGGLYLDAGMLLKAPLNGLDGYDAFLPRAGERLAGWEIMGAAAGHPLLRDIMALYQEAEYQPEDFTLIRHGIWRVLTEQYGLPAEGASTQILEGRIAVYPAEKLLIDVGTMENLAEQVCDGFTGSGRDAVRHQLQKQFYLEHYGPKEDPDEPPQDVFTGTPYQIMDGAVQRYGVVFALRAVCKRILAVALPGLYRRLDSNEDGDS